MVQFLFVFPFLLVLLGQVASQGLVLPSGGRWDARRSCRSSARCVSPQQCQAYRYQQYRPQNFEPCGRRGRNICCPVRVREPPVPNTVRDRPRTDRIPPPQTVRQSPPRRDDWVFTAETVGQRPPRTDRILPPGTVRQRPQRTESMSRENSLRLPAGERWGFGRSSNCGNSAQCMSPQRCQANGYQQYWRQNFESCGRRGRNVCCPNRVREPLVPNTFQSGPRPDMVGPPQILPQGRPRTDDWEFTAETIRPPRIPPGPGLRGSPRTEPVSRDTVCGTSFPAFSSSSNLLRVPFVVGGEEAPEGMYPWMVAILKKRRRNDNVGTVDCTGFLIDYQHALSAAHCFQPVAPSRYSLRIGNIDWRQGTTYEIARIDIPQGYQTGQFYNDLALLTLTRPVNDPNVVPICLPIGDLARRDLTGMGVTVAGWGSHFYGGEMSDKLMHLTAMPVISNTQCNDILERNMTGFRRQFNRGIDRSFLCAGFLEGGKDSCGGDSGGPLMIQQQSIWYAVGIVSFGHECGVPGFPAGYTKISEQMDYIRRMTS